MVEALKLIDAYEADNGKIVFTLGLVDRPGLLQELDLVSPRGAARLRAVDELAIVAVGFRAIAVAAYSRWAAALGS